MTMFLKAGASLRKAIGALSGLVLSGPVTNPTLPAFLAYNSATDTDQTGAGATVTVDFDTEVFDQGGDFATDTFTAPVTGKYALSAQVTTTDLTTAMNSFELNIVTSNRTYRQSQRVNVEAAADYWAMSQSVVADMDAGDTATITFMISGGAGNTADIFGAVTLQTYFSGHLVA